MVKVDFGGTVASIINYTWTCDDDMLLSLLNSILDDDGPSGSDPDPDYTAAQIAIEEVGNGKIVFADDAEFDEDVIY